MNIFIDCNLTHIKMRNSNIFITRLHVHFWIDCEHSSKILYIESDSPQENSLNALDQFNIEVNSFKERYSSEVFSSVNINRSKYRGFEVFDSLSVKNLIKVNKGA